jgi:hypothetical protein
MEMPYTPTHIGQVMHEGKIKNMVHLPKTNALIIGDVIFKYDKETSAEDISLLVPSENTSRRRYMLMCITKAQGQGKMRVIVRSGIMGSGTPPTNAKYYVDFPFSNAIPNTSIAKMQGFIQKGIETIRNRRLLAACMAFHRRLGGHSILGLIDGEMMQRLVGPYIHRK